MQKKSWFSAVWNNHVIYLLAAFTFAAGCGGGGGDDDDGNSNQGANTPQFAPENISGRLLILNESVGSQRRILLEADGQSWRETGTNAPAAGTFDYQRGVSGNTASLTLASPGETVEISLTFSTETSGVFTYASGNGGGGNFVLEAAPSQPGNGNGSGGGNGNSAGFAPATLAGRTMQATRVSTTNGGNGQTHVYTFSSATFHDSDPPEESDGTYAYQPSGDRADLVLDYTYPENFNGDRHQILLRFTAENRGTFTSTYTRRDGTIIAIDGNFLLE